MELTSVTVKVLNTDLAQNISALKISCRSISTTTTPNLSSVSAKLSEL